MLDLDAYATDCRLFGRVDLGDGRLSDHLNATPQLDIHDARLQSLDDGHEVDAGELTVDSDELCAVVAAGPRGDAGRRIRTHATRVAVDLGPYRVIGFVHGTPASDPVGVALRRAAWLALTDATVTYSLGPDPVSDEVATLLVNRTMARSFRAVEEASVLLPWEEPRASRTVLPRAVDLTGTLRDEERPQRDDEDLPRGPGPVL